MKYIIPAIVIIGILIFAFRSQQNKAVNKMPASEVDQFMNEHKNAQLVDVRTPAECGAGMIKGAKQMNVMDSEFDQKLATLDKEKPVVFYCKSGMRSSKAANKAVATGFKEVYNVSGGYMAYPKK